MSAIKFLEAYEKEDIDIFFGRTKETELLYQKVRHARLTLLYGLSGTGKTSLVRCGLANKFHDNDWFELYVRRGSHILKSLREAIEDEAETLIRSRTSLLDALNSLYLDYFRPIYLLFDQFEELFISGTAQEIQEFIDFLAAVVADENLNVRIILILREEYFTRLDDFEMEIPIIFDSRVRLERMSTATLKEVILKIAQEGNFLINNKEKTVQQLIDNISDKNNQVELPYLQVYLDKLSNSPQVKTSAKGEKIFDETLLKTTGKLQDVLGGFLEEQVEIIAQNVSQSQPDLTLEAARDMAWTLLKNMITPDGTKRPIGREALLERMKNE